MKPFAPIFAAFAWIASVHAVDIVAHRGASHDAPENTMAAARLAWEQGADVLETDLHLTSDGKLIVLHDPNTKRTTGHDAPVASLTQTEARALDAGSWKGPQFKGEKLPLLEEQIASVPAGKRMFLEPKIGPEIVPELKRVLAASGGDERKIAIISFRSDTLQKVREELPGYDAFWLVDYKLPDPNSPTAASAKPPPTVDELIRTCKTGGFTGLDLNHKWPLTPADVKKIKAAGLQLHVWTVDDVAIAQHWIDLGVASITTNRPAWLREQLKLR